MVAKGPALSGNTSPISSISSTNRQTVAPAPQRWQQSTAAGDATLAIADATGCLKRRQSCAFVTFLDGSNRGYIEGVLALERALRIHNSAYPLVAALTPTVPRAVSEELLQNNVLVRHIQFLELPEAFAEQAGVLHTPQFMSNFSKLRMWEFCDEYDKLVYLDSDVIPMQNIDDMFMAPHFSASQDNMVPDEGFDAERCQAPSLHMKAPWQTKSAYFNAGVFVFEPSLEELSEIMKTLKYSKLTRYAEQDLLNEFYAGRWNMLPMSYNWGRVNFFVNPEVCPPAALKIVHFSGPAKPWRRHADGSWPEEVYGQVVIGNEKLAMKDRESPFNLAVDRWWDAFEGQPQPNRRSQQHGRKNHRHLCSLFQRLWG